MENQMKDSSISLGKFFVYGLFGGIIATIAAYIGTAFLGLPFPPEAIFQILIAPVPGSIQSVVVETLREYAKYSLFTVAGGIYALSYALIAVFVGFAFRKNFLANSSRALIFATLIPTVVGLGIQGLLASRVSVLSTLLGWLMVTALTVGVNLIFAAIVVNQVKVHLQVPHRLETTEGRVTSLRRGFLKKIVIAAVVLAIAGIASRIGLSVFSGQPLVRSNTPVPINSQPSVTDLLNLDLPAIFRDPRISDLVGSEVTDNRVFYRVDINPIPPQLDFDMWSLKISGKVNNPFIFNKPNFMELPTKDEVATLECVSNTINPPGALISNAKWTGVPLATVLNQAGVSSEAKFVVFHCADGYSVGIPFERAMHPGALLAYKMNDDLLPKDHGFPLRAIVPGIYGMMNAKWITEIEVMDKVYLGYWQERGWSNDAKIRTTSIIYYPEPDSEIGGTLPIAGVAFAGDRGISKVEVSTDGGKTWNEAFLKKPRSPYSWVLWAYEWTPTSKGTHAILARATDGEGQLQDPTFRVTFPDGATGYHMINVTVA